MVYAQINEKNICIAVSEMGNMKVSEPNFIPLDTFDTSVLRKKYNNGVWEEVPEPEPEPIPLTETEQAILDTAVNTEYLVCLADLGI